MDWVAIGAIAAIVSALAAAVSAWVAYREYQDKKNTGQPRSPKRSVPPSVPTQSQQRQAGFFSSKVARRSVLLGSTALGLLLILLGLTDRSRVTIAPNAFDNFDNYFIYMESLGLLVSGVCVVLARPRVLTLWRRLVMWFGVGFVWFIWVTGFVYWWFFTDPSSQGFYYIERTIVENFGFLFTLFDVPGLSGIILLIIYLTSIYIGRW